SSRFHLSSTRTLYCGCLCLLIRKFVGFNGDLPLRVLTSIRQLVRLYEGVSVSLSTSLLVNKLIAPWSPFIIASLFNGIEISLPFILSVTCAISSASSL